MSLPSGVLNRPPVVATHPAAVGRVFRVAGGCFVILLPLLFHVLLQVPGTARRYECVDFQRQINEARAARRTLLAERARLLAPERLREQARRLGLVRPLAGDGPWPVSTPADRIPKPPAPPAPPAEPGAEGPASPAAAAPSAAALTEAAAAPAARRKTGRPFPALRAPQR